MEDVKVMEKRDYRTIGVAALVAALVSLAISFVVPLVLAQAGISPVTVAPYVMPMAISPQSEPDLAYTLEITTADTSVTSAVTTINDILDMTSPATGTTTVTAGDWIAKITVKEKTETQITSTTRVYEIKVFAGGTLKGTFTVKQTSVPDPDVVEGAVLTVDLGVSASQAPPNVAISLVRISD
jgi:hypothetical protein